jgi:hypothetical protein
VLRTNGIAWKEPAASSVNLAERRRLAQQQWPASSIPASPASLLPYTSRRPIFVYVGRRPRSCLKRSMLARQAGRSRSKPMNTIPATAAAVAVADASLLADENEEEEEKAER